MKLQATPRLRRIQIIVLSLIFIAGIINFLDRSSLSIANSTIRSELGLTATQMGLLLSAFSFGYGLCQLPIGFVLERLGIKKAYGFGLFIWSVAQALTGMVTTFPQLMAARIVLGVGESPQLPTGVKVVNDWYNVRERGVPMGIVNMSGALGPAIAPPLLTMIMLYLGWRYMFIALGVLGIVVSFVWLAYYRNRPEADLSKDEIDYLDDGNPPSNSGKITLADFLALFKQRSMWGMIVGFNGVGYMVWLYVNWLPAYLQQSRGLSLANTGFVAAIPFLFGAFGMIVNGYASDWLLRHGADKMKSRKWLICIGLLFAAIFTLPAAYTDSTVMAVAYISMALFSVHFAGTSAWGLILVSTPSRLVSSVTGIQNFGGFIGGMIAPVLTGIIVDKTGSFTLALTLCALIAFIGSLVYFFFVTEPIRDTAAPNLSGVSA